MHWRMGCRTRLKADGTDPPLASGPSPAAECGDDRHFRWASPGSPGAHRARAGQGVGQRVAGHDGELRADTAGVPAGARSAGTTDQFSRALAATERYRAGASLVAALRCDAA